MEREREQEDKEEPQEKRGIDNAPTPASPQEDSEPSREEKPPAEPDIERRNI